VAATTGPITVTPAAATHLVLTTPPPSSVASNVGFSLTVQAQDNFGNLDLSFNGAADNLNVTLNNANGATLKGNLTVAPNSGVATFSPLILDKIGSGYTITVSGPAQIQPGVTTGPITVTSSTSSQLVVTTQPFSQATAQAVLNGNALGSISVTFGGAGYTTVPAVTISGGGGSGAQATAVVSGGVVTAINLTSFGTGYSLPPTVTIAPPKATATATATFVNASMINFTVTNGGAGYLTAPAVTLTGGSGSFTSVTASINAAGQVMGITLTGATGFTSAPTVTIAPPPNVLTAGAPFSLVVSAEDAGGNVDSTFNGPVTVALGTNPNNATLGGTLTVTASAGVARFTGLTINKSGTGYILQVSATNLAVGTSNTITVNPAVATQLGFTTQPPANQASGVGFSVTVTAEDVSGNPVTSFNGPITVALSSTSNPNGATLSGTTTLTASNGSATFSGLSIDKAGTGYTLTATTTGLAAGISSAITIKPAAASQLVVTTEPPISVAPNAGFTIKVSAEDPAGNVDTTFTGSVTVALKNNPGSAALAGTLTVSAVAGVATFTGLSLNKAGVGYTIQATSNPLTVGTSTAFTVNAAAATQLVITAQPPANVQVSIPFSLTVKAEDGSGNVDTTYHDLVTLAFAPSGNPGNATLGGTISVAASNGVAVFSGVTLDQVANGYTLVASANGLSSATTIPINATAAAATQLVVTTQPPSNINAGKGFGLVVTAEDPAGNVDLSYNGPVTVFIASGPSGSSLGGTLAVLASSGVATFTGLTLNKAAGGYTLEVASGTLTGATTNPINVNPSTAAQLAVTTQPPGTVSAGTGFSLTVAVEDSFGNVVPSFSGTVAVALENNPAGATLGGTLSVTPTLGIATFSGLTLNNVANGYTLQVSSSGLPSVTTSPINVQPSLATQLLISTEPPSTAAAGSGFGLVVKAEDASGNLVSTFTGNVTVALNNGPAGESLGGSLTVAAVGGVATFTGLTLNKAASGVTLQVTSTNLTSATTSAITVTPLAATQLVVSTEPPSSVPASTGFSLAVEAEDAFGNLATSFTGSVTITIGSNPGGATLGGTTTVTASNGLASFSGLTLDKAGSNYLLQATSSGLTSATTTAITVTPASVSQLVVSTQPPLAVTAGTSFGLVVQAEDASGNPISSFNGDVAIALSSNPGGATLGGTTTVTASGGVATFAGLTLDKAASGYTLQVSSTGLNPATTRAITVNAATVSQLVVTTEPPTSVAPGGQFQVVVAGEDPLGNVDPTFTGNVALTLTNNTTGATLSGPTSLAAVAGVATFDGLSIDKTGSGYTIQVSSGSLAGVLTSTIAVSTSAATQLVVTIQPPSSATAGSGFGLVVKAEDSHGNVDAAFNGQVAVAIATGPGGGVLAGTASVTASAGIATFSGLSLNKAASYTLRVSANAVSSATTGAISVTHASATQLAFTAQPPTSVVSGTVFGLTVSAEDQFGNLDPTFAGTVTLATSNPLSGTLSGTVTATATAGVATFTSLSLGKAGTGITLQATTASLSAATSTPITITPAAATQLVVTTQPPTSVPAGSGFGLVVSAEDSAGNVDPTFHGDITIALAANPGGTGATLSGTLTVTAVNGQATFSLLSLNTAAAGYTIQATTTAGLTATTSNPITVTALPSAQLVLTTAPPSSVVAGAGFGLVVSAEDNLGNIDPTFNGLVTLSLSTNPGGATAQLGGTISVNAVGGVATFSGVTLNRVASGYTIQASGGGLSVTTGPITVTPGAVSQLVVLNPPPASVAAGTGFGLTIQAEDNAGNPSTTFNGTVTLALASSPSGAALGGTVQATAVSGIATFSGLTLNIASSGYTLRATSNSLTPATTTAITITPGQATQLLVTGQPPTTVAAGDTFSLTITAEDAFGNVATGFTGSVAVALKNNPGGATASLGGTTSVTAVAGVATFSGLTLNRPASGYTLQATSTGLTSVTTTAITVNTSLATRLVVVTEPPSSVSPLTGFTIVVRALDNAGNLDTTFKGLVSLTLTNNTTGATLGGTISRAASAGVATFTGLTLDKAGSGYTIVASVSGGALTSATSTAITVTPSAATQLAITTQPPASVHVNDNFGLVVTAEDLAGNTDPTYNGAITLAVSNPVDGTLGGTVTVTAVNGVASFPNLNLNEVASGVTLVATATGLTSATTSAINVTAAPAVQLVVTSQPVNNVTAGTGFNLVIQAQDSLGNVDLTFNGNVTVTLSNNPGTATLGGTVTVPAINGVATFTGLVLNKAGIGYTLNVSGGGLSTTTNPITIVGGPAIQLGLFTPPPSTVIAGTGFNLVVAAEDGFGNVDSSYTGNVTLSLANNPAHATLGGTLTVPAVAGLATFSGLTLNDAASGYTLRASSGGLAQATSTAITVHAASAQQLVVTTEPPGSVTAGDTFGLVVLAEDSLGNVDPDFTGNVSLVLSTNPGGATLGGTVTEIASGGEASFSDLTLDRAAAGYTLQADSVGLAPAMTSPMTVKAGHAVKLVLTSEPPGSATAGKGFGLGAAAEDRFGNVDPTFNGSVSVNVANNSSATLGGPLSVSAAGGQATFSNLTLNLAGNGSVLQVSSSGLASAQTTPVGVVSAAVQVVSVSLPQVVHIGKRKTVTEIIVQFNGALNATSAMTVSNYQLSTVAQGRLRSKTVKLAQALYNSATHTVSLVLKQKVTLKQPLQLRIIASGLLDIFGRQLDGNHDGQPGGDFLATMSKSGVSIKAVSAISAGGVQPLAVPALDSLIETGFRPRRHHSHP
jgi:hypothetical protein